LETTNKAEPKPRNTAGRSNTTTPNAQSQRRMHFWTWFVNKTKTLIVIKLRGLLAAADAFSFFQKLDIFRMKLYR